MPRRGFLSCARSIVKQFLPYGVESAYIKKRYGQATYFDRIAEGESRGQFVRIVRWILPYGLVSLRDRLAYRVPSPEKQRAEFPRIAEKIRARQASGWKIRVLYMVSDASMFAARPLFEAMAKSTVYEPRIVVIPDFRHGERNAVRNMERCEESLARIIPEDRLVKVRPGADGDWPDVLGEADMVCYPTPHDCSFWRYSIRASADRDVLPIHVNYGFYRSVYDRSIMSGENYARFWRVFFECEETMSEYAEHSILRGANAVLTGYVKMDSLASARPVKRSRKRILVALHHSVEGGKNERLLLANIARYAGFFMKMPDRWPEIDFVFRPHPFLAETLAQPCIWGARRTEEYFAALRLKPNVIWSECGDPFAEFAESDGCIQDCGSFLVEYLYTGKPCCYMLKSPADIDGKFAPLGRKCLGQCYVAYDTDAIDSFIRDVVAGGNDPKAQSRAALARSVMINYPHAAEAALEAMKGIPVP
ncbi:MAG: hypothetical protein K6F50_02150 [Kiritimatiellae bacterium]|nr:hypothetical protein [Kiritimatiellia bacterium]